MTERRRIIRIDEEKCDGCGQCISGCPEGALQLIDGKARLVSDIYCDGLGACIGDCPRGAISVEEREAERYDERRVMENIVQLGMNTIIAHLRHLYDHAETGYLKEALDFLRERGIEVDEKAYVREEKAALPVLNRTPLAEGKIGTSSSGLSNWPVQLHLISPRSSYFKGADILLAADCTAYAFPGFHERFLGDRKLIIACPKLDSGIDRYVEKLASLGNDAGINSITVLIMEVPCCRGLIRLVERALKQIDREIPVEVMVISTQGEILDRYALQVS